MRSEGQRKQCARNRGRAGGLSKAKKMAATLQGQERQRWNGLRLYERQIEIYGAVFANRVHRNPRGPRPKEQAS